MRDIISDFNSEYNSVECNSNSNSNYGNSNSIPIPIPVMAISIPIAMMAIPELEFAIHSNSGAELTPALVEAH